MNIEKNIKYILNNKSILERKYNQSFNKNKINDPKNSFISIEKINKFKKTSKNINYKEYYIFLSNHFNEDFLSYLSKLQKKWQELDIHIEEESSINYLFKKFIIDPINGLLEEEKALNDLRKKFNQIRKPTPEEDISECFDFEIIHNNQKIRFQHKPISFYKGLQKTTNYSFKKIEKSYLKSGIPYFFTVIKNNNTCVLLRKKEGGLYFLPINKFELNKINEKQIIFLSQKTFLEMKNKNNNISYEL